MVTVVIPAYNCEAYIGQAMDSVLKQTTKEEIEILVIDDGSTDHTREVVQSYMNRYANLGVSDYPRSISYHSNGKNKGVAETRNVGIRAAQGEYIAFLDADDWWMKEKLKKQLALIREKKAVLVYTARELMQMDGTTAGKVIEVPRKVTYDVLLKTNSIPCSSVLIKSDVAREFYMCHDELHEDYILWLRVLKKYKKAYGINESLLKSRLSEKGKSRNKWKSARMHFGVYRYLQLPLHQSIWYFISYAIHGVLKYRGASQK